MPRRSRQPSIPERIALFEALCQSIRNNEPYKTGGYGMLFGVRNIDAPLEVKIPPAVPLSAQWPDREQLRSYLIQFRQFLNASDPTYLAPLLRQVPRYIDDAALRDRVTKAYATWQAAQGVGWPRFELDGEVLLGADVARLYLNGGMFHSDPELTARWNALSPQYRDVYQHKFMFYVGEVRGAAIALRDALRDARASGSLREAQLFDLALRPLLWRA